MISDEISARVNECAKRRFLWNLWTKLIRREFLATEQIRFVPNMVQDMLVTCCMICSAKKYLRVPYVINCRRVREDSVSCKSDLVKDYLQKWLHTLITGFEYLEEFLSRREIFQQNPNLKYIMLDTYIRELVGEYFIKPYAQLPAHTLNELLQKSFTDNAALTAFVLSDITVSFVRILRARYQAKKFIRSIFKAQKRIEELETEIQQLKAGGDFLGEI